MQQAGEEGYKQYSSSVTLTKEEVIEKISKSHPEIMIDFNQENAIEIIEYTDSGRVKTIRLGNIQISGVEARSIFGLKSTKFNVSVGETINFDVIRLWTWRWNESNWCR